MPRSKRECPDGLIYHVLNRSVAGIALFKSDRDYEAWEATLRDAILRYPIDLLAYCAMPNHFHLVLRPRKDGDLSKFMQWFTLAHVQRWRFAHQTVGYGPLYQGRFKSFAIEADDHLITVLRYVERNAVRAGLVDDVANWRWGSFYTRGAKESPVHEHLIAWPVDVPKDWRRFLNKPQTRAEEEAMRKSIQRSCPFGSPTWQERIAKRLMLKSCFRPVGRPRRSNVMSRVRRTSERTA
jgi:putative transposase